MTYKKSVRIRIRNPEINLPCSCNNNKFSSQQISLMFFSQISGCLFHYCRAIDTNIGLKKLGELRKKSIRFGHAVRMVKALPYLRPEDVQDGFLSIIHYLDAHAEVEHNI